MTATSTIQQITGAFIEGNAFLRDRPDDQRLARAIYRLLATGRPAEIGAIAADTGRSEVEIERRLATWPATFRNDDGGIVAFWGMTCDELSPHRMEVEGFGTAWAWCAIDPLFLAPVIGAPADITSRCPTTGETVRLTVNPDGGMTRLDPPTAVMSMRAIDMAFDDQVIATLCDYVHLFASPEAAEAWTAEHPGTFWLPMADAVEIARAVTCVVFGTVVSGVGTPRATA